MAPISLIGFRQLIRRKDYNSPVHRSCRVLGHPIYEKEEKGHDEDLF